MGTQIRRSYERRSERIVASDAVAIVAFAIAARIFPAVAETLVRIQPFELVEIDRNVYSFATGA